MVKMKYYTMKYPYPCDDNIECSEFEIVLTRGYWKIECWGASGGDSYHKTLDVSFPGGRGGYSVGVVNITEEIERFYLYIGGQGTSNRTTKGVFPGGFNGGGSGNVGTLGYWGGSGGGGTDVRRGGKAWDHRIIVAGGGGGAGAGNSNSIFGGGQYGGYGGGINGSDSGIYSKNDTVHTSGGGTQYKGGKKGYNPLSPERSGKDGQKGIGGGFDQQDTGSSGGGGGGGLYGGGSSDGSGGGGGSGYIGGVISYKNIIARTVNGNDESFPSPYTGNENGHVGNGFILITDLNTYINIECIKECNSFHQLLPLISVIILFKNSK